MAHFAPSLVKKRTLLYLRMTVMCFKAFYDSLYLKYGRFMTFEIPPVYGLP